MVAIYMALGTPRRRSGNHAAPTKAITFGASTLAAHRRPSHASRAASEIVFFEGRVRWGESSDPELRHSENFSSWAATHTAQQAGLLQ